MLLSVTPEGATGNDLLVIVQNANILVDGDEGFFFNLEIAILFKFEMFWKKVVRDIFVIRYQQIST